MYSVRSVIYLLADVAQESRMRSPSSVVYLCHRCYLYESFVLRESGSKFICY